MVILLVADLHYDLRKFDWVTNIAPTVDLVVIAGDHLEIASTVDRSAQSILVQKYFQRIRERTDLIVSSGNHDLDSPDGNGEMTTRWIANARHFGIPTDGDTLKAGDALVTICPWIDGEHQQAAQTARFERDAARAIRPWTWVYHAPPDGSCTSYGRGRSWGDTWLTDWIGAFSPDIVLTGHVHEAPFSKGGRWADRVGNTWVFNAGHQHGPRPSFVVIDTDARQASWNSQAGTEQVDLGAASEAASPHPIAFLDLPASIAETSLSLER